MCLSIQTVLTLAALRIVSAQAKEARLTLVTARPLNIDLATALTSNHAEGRVGVAIAHPSILRPIWVTVTSYGTDKWETCYKIFIKIVKTQLKKKKSIYKCNRI